MTDLLGTALKVKLALTSIGASPVSRDGKSVEGEDTDALVAGGCLGITVVSVALCGIVFSVFSMMATVSIIVDIASISLLVLAPYALYQKRELRNLGSLRDSQNELRLSVNKIASENDKFKASVDNLARTQNSLRSVEKDLEKIAKKSGAQVDRLVSIIEETKTLQEKIKKNLEASVIQNAMQIMLKSDRNGDFKFETREMTKLRKYLETIPGVKVNRTNFDKYCGSGKVLEIKDVMAMFRNLKDDKVPPEDNIFILEPSKIISSGGLFG